MKLINETFLGHIKMRTTYNIVDFFYKAAVRDPDSDLLKNLQKLLKFLIFPRIPEKILIFPNT